MCVGSEGAQINMLKQTPFFSSWSEMSMARLYFWFQKKRLPPETDVVKQGDDADFCFIIRSGRCDVLVEMKEEPKKEETPTKPSPEASSENTPNDSPVRPSSMHPWHTLGDLGHLSRTRLAPASSGRYHLQPPGAHRPLPSLSSPAPLPPSRPEPIGLPPAPRPCLPFAQMQKRPTLGGMGGLLGSKKKDLLKMASAAAFKAAAGIEGQVLRANMRHIVTLRPGAIVGEIALFKDGVKRMATVRTSDNVDLLILDKKSFLDLDRATLTIISENARYNAACTKEPHQRTRDDLQILQQRTSHLSHLSSLSSDVQLELCRVMRYRKVNEASMLVRKGMPAQCLYVLISGTCNTYTAEPRRRWSLATGALDLSGGLGGALRSKKSVGVEAFSGMKATDTLHTGQAIGEDELLQEDPVYSITAITNEPVELMEIDRKDFDRILKADRTSERGRLIDFVSSLSMMDGISVAAVHALTNIVTRKTFMRNQPCLAHPPDPSLGPASFSYDFVYLIFSGEARLCCNADPNEKRLAP